MEGKNKEISFDFEAGSSSPVGSPQPTSQNCIEDQAEGTVNLDFIHQKKKRKGRKRGNDMFMEDEAKIEIGDKENNVSRTDQSRLISDGGDYSYYEMLNRALRIMIQKNPEISAPTKQKFILRPPEVIRVGTKKTSFVNFIEICKMLHRHPNHLLDFLLSELGTSGSVDGSNQLIIRGRFKQNQIENVLRRYIKGYVTCHTCRSPNTILQKESRLYFLQCETCGSRCSVDNIKRGFQALTGSRASIRVVGMRVMRKVVSYLKTDYAHLR